ncbi:lysophospholipid transporter LplT [Zophobihabitans entericus]|uniref:Lysophospholipid transporter LplT n=1 Tax=Zophobihabitans entericus TaxID=1635327 RepID=A0A6G9ICE2_9GAMM|nr:lysophospholipid transporter LplT [Zophobihabitans entericus]QIQ21507.1 lysophospholipid transporter LplT [Zophobihabitans entericus]
MNPDTAKKPLLNKGMSAVMLAQFFSAFGDNALLFALLAFIKDLQYPDWSRPVLQMAFVVTYIVTAPFVGHIADGFSKGRVMMMANGLKVLGATAVCVGFDPFLGYVLVGLGAAFYSPAKYGILGELTTEDKLVKANGLIEASTIAAILLGSIAGGYVADLSVMASLIMCSGIFLCAVIANFYIPKLQPARKIIKWDFKQILVHFIESIQALWKDKYARFTLLGTSLFWGAGITLRFLLIDWVPIALGISDNKTPTILNGIVAIGIVIGAGLAAKLVSLNKITRCIPAGIVMGICVSYLVMQENVYFIYALLVLIGALGGFFLVPLNAYLQDFGKKTVGAGNAIAVQNISENSVMLIMLGIYSVVVALGIPVIWIGVGFGGLFACVIFSLWLWQKVK